jgi:hypothetical protein
VIDVVDHRLGEEELCSGLCPTDGALDESVQGGHQENALAYAISSTASVPQPTPVAYCLAATSYRSHWSAKLRRRRHVEY